MKRNVCMFAMTIALIVSVISTANAASDAKRGEALYQAKCSACHSIDYNGVGPAHKGLMGRKFGAQSDYNYSSALKASRLIWTEKTLDQWLANPEKLVAGQKMGMSVPSAKDRADLIAYLNKATR
jgi:cytochrome c